MNVINTNMYSINAQRHMQSAQEAQATTMERLSSGSRINSAADDAAGLTMVERMNSQVTGLKQSIRNANDAVSMVQVADSAMGSITELLQRMRELSVQGSTGTYTDSNRGDMQDEFSALQDEISRTIGATKYNDMAVLNRDPSAAETTIDFQVGWDNAGVTSGSFEGIAATTELRTPTKASGTDGSSGTHTGTTPGTFKSGTGADASDTVELAAAAVFAVEIDGVKSKDITLGADTKSMSAWATEIQAQINASTDAASGALGDVNVSWDTTGKSFVITSESIGTSSQVVMVAPSTGTEPVELGLKATTGTAASGNATATQGSYTGFGVDGAAGAGVNVELTAASEFTVEIDGVASETITLGAGTKSKSAWATEIQTKINDAKDTAAGALSDVTVNYDATNDKFVITSDSSGATSQVSVLSADDTLTTLGIGAEGGSTVVSLEGVPLADREITVSVDGGAAKTVTLPQSSKTADEWASYLETEIGAVSVAFDAATEQFSITSSSTGKSSDVTFTGEFTKLGITGAGTATAGHGDINQISMSHYDLDDVSNDLGSLLLNTEDINSQANAMAMIGKLDSAIDFMNDARSHFGATQNRLEMATENLQSMHENHSSSRSRIKDVDFAAESAEMARVNVLQQAGISMLAQANQAPQQLMKLLQ